MFIWCAWKAEVIKACSKVEISRIFQYPSCHGSLILYPFDLLYFYSIFLILCLFLAEPQDKTANRSEKEEEEEEEAQPRIFLLAKREDPFYIYSYESHTMTNW